MGARGKALWGVPGRDDHLVSICPGWPGASVVGNDHSMVLLSKYILILVAPHTDPENMATVTKATFPQVLRAWKGQISCVTPHITVPVSSLYICLYVYTHFKLKHYSLSLIKCKKAH